MLSLINFTHSVICLISWQIWYLVWWVFKLKIKVNVKFAVLEISADWHELMIPQRTTRLSIACVSEQLDPQFATSRHTIAPISNTRPSS